jgi:hypothetical protein
MAQSGNAALQGVWTINKIEIKKTIDNDPPTSKVFYPGDDMSFGFETPVKITFAADQVIFEYANWQDSGEYYLENNRIHIDFPDQSCVYTYTLAGESIRLGSVISYVINEDKQVRQAEEQYTLYGQK